MNKQTGKPWVTEKTVRKYIADNRSELVMERVGKKIEVTNNNTGITGVYDTLADAYIEIVHYLI
jgi:hypothetical protein